MERWCELVPPSVKALGLLVSPGFLVGLCLLLLNDLFLKQSFHNALTGKLSDFAGLFVFPLFWTAFFPRKRSFVYLLTLVSFVLWKSVYSQPLIDSWNSLGLFSIARTIDYSDLLALSVLPVSYSYGQRTSVIHRSRQVVYCLAILSLFAFMATSYRHETQHSKEYYFPMSKQELLERMSLLPKDKVDSEFWRSDDFEVRYSCTRANFSVAEKNNQAVIILTKTNFRCPSPPETQYMIAGFDKEFIDMLKEAPVTRPSQIESIRGIPSQLPEATLEPKKIKSPPRR